MTITPHPKRMDILDSLPDAYVVLDGEWRFIFLNSTAENMLSRKKESVLGKNVWEEFPEEAGSARYHAYHRALEQQITIHVREYFDPEGSWLDITVSPYEDGVCIHFRDVTMVKSELDERKERYSSLFDNHPDAVYSTDKEGRIVSVNARFEQIFRVAKQEAFHVDFTALAVPEDAAVAGQCFRQALGGESLTCQWRVEQTDGSVQTLLVTNVPITVHNEIIGVYGIARDITEQKRANEDLKRSRANLQQALRIARLGNCEWDHDKRELIISDEMKRILGIAEERTYIKMNAGLDWVHKEDLPSLRNQVHQALDGTPLDTQFRYMHPDGSVRHLKMMAELVREEAGSRRLIATISDVTEAVQRQEKLRKSEELYKLISENSQDAISLSEPDGTIYYVSPGIRHLLGYEPYELIGRKRSYYYHEDDVKNLEVPSGLDTVVTSSRCRHKNGQYVWVETATKLVRDPDGNVIKILGIGRDITQRIAAEELVVKSEKLTLTGQLAAGIAHEIRNPLTAIKGFLQLIDNGYALKNEHVKVMSSELMRIEGILNELLLLAKPHEVKFYRKDINAIIRQVTTLMETEAIMKNVLMYIRLPEQPLYVDCDENQLKQIFINFIKNGMESMAQGGEMSIEAVLSQGLVTVSFTDTGSGISPEQLERIGQPFFSTKEKGTGLGLAVSFSIIENHKGKVSVKSELGKGTTFTISFLPSIE